MEHTFKSRKLRASRHGFFMLGIADVLRGADNWRLSHLMGLGEIRRRYARSKIGQFWLTISTGIMVAALGLVWSTLWHVPAADLVPYVAISLIVWTMITGTLGEAATLFPSNGSIFLNQGMSFSTAIYALVYRHLLIFLHNVPIIVIAVLHSWLRLPHPGVGMEQLSRGDCMRALSRSNTSRAKRTDGHVLHHPGLVEAGSNPARCTLSAVSQSVCGAAGRCA